MPRTPPPADAPDPPSVATAYLVVRRHLRDRLAAHPDVAQPWVQRALDALEALAAPPGAAVTVADQPDPRTPQYQAEARDEIAREKLDP